MAHLSGILIVNFVVDLRRQSHFWAHLVWTCWSPIGNVYPVRRERESVLSHKMAGLNKQMSSDLGRQTQVVRSVVCVHSLTVWTAQCHSKFCEWFVLIFIDLTYSTLVGSIIIGKSARKHRTDIGKYSWSRDREFPGKNAYFQNECG